MLRDAFGQMTSLTDTAVLAEWDRMQRAFLAHAANTPQHLGAVLGAEPDFAQAHAVKAMFYALLGRREVMEIARDAIATARDCQPGATEREALYLRAAEACLAGYPSQAVQAMEQVLDRHPTDALAAKLSHAFRFVLGDASGMRASIERVLPAYAPDHPARGYLLGCHAFALEETGEYHLAEVAGRQALWTAPDDAWGLHAVAHVYDMTGKAERGLEWLTGREAAWAHCNNFRYHVWWHKALMHLDLGQIDEVMRLYDQEIRADKTDDYRDISNATSLLMRLELDGVNVGSRWEELADLSAARTDDGCLIFADLHYLLALAGDKRQLDAHRLVARIAKDGQAAAGDMGPRMARPGLNAAHGLEAFGEGDYDTAFGNLAAARDAMQMTGGSHAQRDVFERLTIDCGLRSGRIDHAEAILQDRQRRRGGRLDAYAAARFDLISAARSAAPDAIPAE